MVQTRKIARFAILAVLLALLFVAFVNLSARVGALHASVASGNLFTTRMLLVFGANPNQPDPRSPFGKVQPRRTPLQIAVERDDLEITRTLLQRGANPNANAASIRILGPPLTVASSTSNDALLKLLIQYGADPNIEGVLPETNPFVASVISRCYECMETLKIAGIDLNGTRSRADWGVKLAFTTSDDRLIHFLLPDLIGSYRDRVQPLSGIELPEITGRQIDEIATSIASLGQQRAAEKFAQEGSPGIVALIISTRSPYSWMDYVCSPLHTLAELGDSRLLEYLIESGGLLNYPDSLGATPIMIATREWQWPAIEVLLNAGANTEGKDAYGQSLAHYLAFTPVHRQDSGADRDFHRIIEEFASRGINFNATDNRGNTLLHSLASRDDSAHCALVLAHGADPSIKNLSGQTPYDTAILHGATESANLLQLNQISP